MKFLLIFGAMILAANHVHGVEATGEPIKQVINTEERLTAKQINDQFKTKTGVCSNLKLDPAQVRDLERLLDARAEWVRKKKMNSNFTEGGKLLLAHHLDEVTFPETKREFLIHFSNHMVFFPPNEQDKWKKAIMMGNYYMGQQKTPWLSVDAESKRFDQWLTQIEGVKLKSNRTDDDIALSGCAGESIAYIFQKICAEMYENALDKDDLDTKKIEASINESIADFNEIKYLVDFVKEQRPGGAIDKRIKDREEKRKKKLQEEQKKAANPNVGETKKKRKKNKKKKNTGGMSIDSKNLETVVTPEETKEQTLPVILPNATTQKLPVAEVPSDDDDALDRETEEFEKRLKEYKKNRENRFL